MAQLGYGMRQLLDQIEAEIADLIEDRYNPGAVEGHGLNLKRLITEQVQPRLMRAEPTVEQKIRELEERHQAEMKVVFDRLDKVENRVIIVKEAKE